LSNRRPDGGRLHGPGNPLRTTRQTLQALVRNNPEETYVFQEAIVRLTMMRMGAIASALTALAIFAGW
jgi:hypothetical protein